MTAATGSWATSPPVARRSSPTIEDGYLLLVRQGNERWADRP